MAKALIVVDVQNDFCEGGALAVEGGHATAHNIANYLSERGTEYDLVVATRDWHDADNDNGGHFSDHPDFIDSWPPHCVAGTDGAAFNHAVWPTGENYPQVEVRKGQGKPDYTGFQGVDEQGRDLATVLKEADITDADVVGIAFDYCVKATSIDAATLGIKTRVLEDLTAAIHQDDTAANEMKAAGVEITTS